MVAVLLLSNAFGVTGTINVFLYVQAVYLLPYAVLAVPVATAAFPRLAARAAEGDRAAFAATAARTSRAVLGVGLLGAAVLAATAPAVAAFFSAIDAGEITGMEPALTAIAPGVVGFALIAHVGRALYALERGRWAAGATAAGWLAVVAASVAAVLLVPAEQVVVALALGSSVGMIVAGALLLAGLRACAGAEALAGVGRTLVAGVVGGLAGVLAARWVAVGALDAWGTTAWPAVAAGACAALVVAVVAGAGVAVLDAGTARTVVAMLRRRPTPAPEKVG